MQTVFASDFASLADLEAFNEAKAKGWSDKRAFAVGDNCVGCWGDFTGTEDKAICALPYEVWFEVFGSGAKARGAQVLVTVINGDGSEGKSCICELRDTMPHKANITNGCGIDLNPGALKLLGLKSPIKQKVTWEWALKAGAA